MYDEQFLDMAFEEAEKARDRGDVPIGAALVIDGTFYAGRGNTATTHDNPSYHAENMLLIENTPAILNARREDQRVELFSTLEPCMMCWGTAIHTGIHRIVYACPDPFGGATSIEPKEGWLLERIPDVSGGTMREKSYQMLMDFAKDKQYWKKFHQKLETLHKSW